MDTKFFIELGHWLGMVCDIPALSLNQDVKDFLSYETSETLTVSKRGPSLPSTSTSQNPRMDKV